MNITLLRLRPVVKELREIRHELTRLADCWELELAQQGVHVRPPKADTSGPEPTVAYTDEEEDYMRETISRLQREDKRKQDEEADA